MEYIEPEGKRKLNSCSGLAIRGRLKVAIDINPGRQKTRDYLLEFCPDIALVSHYHPDHSAWGSEVMEYTRAELMVPSEEKAYFKDLDHEVTNMLSPEIMKGMFRESADNLLAYKELNDIMTYESGSSFILGDISIQCIHTAGHSPGHTSFLFPEQKILFTADMGIDRQGPWYGWTNCSIEAMVESILTLKALSVNLLLTSHGGIIARDIPHCWDRCLIHILEREQRIRQSLDKGMTREQIIGEGVLFPKKLKIREPIKSVFTKWDSIMFDLHAEILKTSSLRDLFPDLRGIELENPKI